MGDLVSGHGAGGVAASQERQPTPMELLPNDAMRKFVEFYVQGAPPTGRRFNKSASALAAGYSEGPNTGYRLYGRADVRAAIDWHLDQVSLSNREIEGRLIEMATAEIGEILDTSGVVAKIDIKKLEKYKHLIKSVNYDSNGNLRVEFHDAHRALQDLIRIRGMAKEGVELSGPGGAAVPIQIAVNFVAPPRPVDNDQRALPGGDENQE